MRTPTYVEDQYRLVGLREDQSISITWHDTFDAAMQAALQYVQSSIYRPDGSYVGTFGRIAGVARG